MDVDLYVYDLSRMSLALLGTHIDAVYHTAIVFGGVEVFFGPGVVTCQPGSTHHGAPMEIIRLGKTSLPQEVIAEYLDALKKIYTAEVGTLVVFGFASYDLFLHNCNNFSNDFAMFLVGKNIPDHITSLPQTVLNTPFGQMMKPQLDSAMRSMAQAPLPRSSAPAAQAVRPVQRPAGDGSRSTPKAATSPAGVVHMVTTLPDLNRLLSMASTKCAAIFFTSSTCPPCKLVYPAYDELAADAGNQAILIKVDIGRAHAIAAKYGIRATPTFITFLRGQKENEWTGASEQQLRGNIRMLLDMARHPHLNLPLPPQITEPAPACTYETVPPLDKLMLKMGDTGRHPAVVAVRNFVAMRSSQGAAEATLPDLGAFGALVQMATRSLSEETLFPLVDLLRVAVVDGRCVAFYAEEKQHSTVAALLHYVNDDAASVGPRSFALRLVTLQLLCNLVRSSLFARDVLAADPDTVSSIIRFLGPNLSDAGHEKVRIAAASLAYNIAACNYRGRRQDDAELVPLAEQLPLLVSVVDAISVESTSAEALRRNLLALALLVYCAPAEAETLDYVKVADVAGVVRQKATVFPRETLVKDVGETLLAAGALRK
ncbi:MAG: hypothetical protein M1826_004728 [Phylliscum demangeonii]|nr:MAG: hypothetical protein M1826_004728 [Phylliscum demangeonii]